MLSNNSLNVNDLINHTELYDDGFHFFWKGPFSQWKASEFVHDGVRFPTAEHWMMYRKAEIFADEESMKKILEAKTPKEAKDLGRNVRNFDECVWDELKMQVVMFGNLLKFSQHKDLRDKLLITGKKVLVEASPYDRVWGIGLDANDELAKNPAMWKGENKLGFCLMSVRESLKALVKIP